MPSVLMLFSPRTAARIAFRQVAREILFPRQNMQSILALHKETCRICEQLSMRLFRKFKVPMPAQRVPRS